MDRDRQLSNAVKYMSERYKLADTPDLEERAELYAARIKNQLILDGFSEREVESARIQAKWSVS
ncbi:hypothetical protein [Paenibacillus cremeus]|uniref:Uncharacterized protein n=1 Tax=Paenibacillus cremeus TaxID=2163881 RepID=A0A559KEG6_9BACL|nr:hypothetical protein [Paenibacillus cremeus]TVY10517.1 hypothetical protein FPZ49_07205 [Paenibacillus cremeus]